MIVSTLAAAVGPALGDERDDDASRAEAHAEKTVHGHAHWVGDETIAMLVYSRFTALDLFGPQHMFGSLMGAKVLLVAVTADPVAWHLRVKHSIQGAIRKP
jgi:hypothetical protein